MIGEGLVRVLLLTEYNTRVVMFGTVTLGIAGGVIGVFLLLRGRALLADAVSHAALPGVAGMFMILLMLGGPARSLPLLMAGALLSGLLGMGCVAAITRSTRISQDAALGIVLSVFFGFGAVLLSIVQKMRGAPAAGLNSFIYGRTASMIRGDAILIGVAALVILITTFLLFKEFRLVTFDPGFAAGQGWPVSRLDLFLMTLVVAVTVLGLQAVGIILIIAILVVPPAAARFWTESLRGMILISGTIGALGGYAGTAISAVAPRLPAGAVIVTVLGTAFLISLFLGARRGIAVVAFDQYHVQQKVAVQNLLRALFECQEHGDLRDGAAQMEYLTGARGWSAYTVRRGLRRLRKKGWIFRVARGPWQFTEQGRVEAMRVTRNHRLWEVYLLEHADVAPANVDQGADYIEHVLGDALVAELEKALPRFGRALPGSPHGLRSGVTTGVNSVPGGVP